MNDEQRQEIIRRLQQDEELSPEWARILFPPEKREYELIYHGKEREEDIIANTLAVPLQRVRTFGKNGDGEVVPGFAAGDSTWPGHNPARNFTVLRSIFQGI